ncbi:MAG: EAL domain-containing response regulator [Gammaproteobacteria bacterium]|nr:EAL domain-containing response regulator [Gammaproteobacteria bacterium]
MDDHKDFRILVIDDEAFMLKLIGKALHRLGYSQVFTCSGGQSGLDFIKSAPSPPQLVLLDLNMPQMDGIEFIRHLADGNFTGSIILISGEDERTLQSVEKLLTSSRITVLGYLVKPVKPAALKLLIERWRPFVSARQQSSIKTYSVESVSRAIHNAELVNYYQPKVQVASGEIVGVETLVRWQHPADGLIYPDRFVPLAENNNLIDELSYAIIRQALGDLGGWQLAGLSLPVSINLSMENLKNLDFADAVFELIAQAGQSAEDITLEVTESRLVQSIKVALDILTRFKLKRVNLSIDDFGTGHSSLSQLRDFPFDELKVDRGFVHGAWANKKLHAIYSASLGLARQLEMTIVAEGVEDLDDWNLLRQSGCDQAQGYFIARPMPAQDVPAWVADWEIRRRELVTQASE